METYYSVAFKSVRRKLGYNESEFAHLLDIEETELRLIEECAIIPDTPTIVKLDSFLLRESNTQFFLNLGA